MIHPNAYAGERKIPNFAFDSWRDTPAAASRSGEPLETPGQCRNTINVESANEALVQPVQLLLVVKLQDELARATLRGHLDGYTRPDVLLQLVDRSLTVRVHRFASSALRPAASSARRHFFDLPDREFPARGLLRQVKSQFWVVNGEQGAAVASG